MIITYGDTLELDLHCAEGEPPRLVALRHAGATLAAEPQDAAIRRMLPLTHVEFAGHTRETNSKRHIGGVVGTRLVYTGHRVVESEAPSGSAREILEVTAHDPVTGADVVTCLEHHPGIAAIRAWSRITAGPAEPLVLLHATSLLVPGAVPVADGRWEERLTVWSAANPWCGEGRWSGRTLAERGLNPVAPPDAKNRISLASTGSWSSGEHLPMGALVDEQTGRALLWQIEHNGSWAWEIGDFHDAGVYLGLSGPCDAENQWSTLLGPDETFTTVPVTIAASTRGIEGAAAELTRHRRRTRRRHTDHRQLPIIFNDYMNCLWGDPSTERLLPLVQAAAEAGAEYFVIDAGWYDDTAGWWDSVGDWLPSTVRFPGGLEAVVDQVRALGMKPGIWLEPEVVGVRSEAARTLPPEAFFTRAGRRLTERGRHQLDLRHPAARAHLDVAVDRLIEQFGLEYLKFDYNIEIGPGTDHDAQSAGDGLLGHNRAYLEWINALLDRHPGLVVESCASGGLRTDHAMLATAQLHSVTDQTDFRLIPAIAAPAPLAVTPEQTAVWAYPIPESTDEETAFTLAGALLGRIHLSGRLDQLRPEQTALVHEAMAAYRDLRPHLPVSVPHWPLGLPAWRDGWTALAMEIAPETDADSGPAEAPAAYVLIWRRDSEQSEATLPLPWLTPVADTDPILVADVAFPLSSKATTAWNPAARELTVTLPNTWSAVLLRLTVARS
ncbi:alpha-galactosidase [Actinospica durhamensis]|uniref:Alpha-galactosidase n=1 Tax=Actinospica durhamensis TaxID=1508375 RepID=A0A941EUX5_9ACTN|nr:alpha-galactosidase [Actinospica durhamensis]MBR7837698.1 alpha-galactosidase [Actinospica durhamensis]